ncbi:MAG TPA: coproporphyrinogen-III oxidase family protein [Kofleriaceae bacterium]
MPWCRKLCPYCDFAVEVAGPDGPPHDAYLAALQAELERRKSAFSGELASIYFGGGTPSMWRPDCLAQMVQSVRAAFPGAPREVTIEANPTDVTDENVAAWRAAGITRLSIGVQSLEPGALVTLGRDHRFGDGRAAVERALAAGLETSADFILGVPGSSGAFESLPSPHLSVYELTIEERTAFGARVRDGRMTPLDEDTLTERYLATHAALLERGYEHYEISSYAKPGHRAVHNSLYWQGSPFIGLGVGAASLEVRADGSGARATNPRRWTDYQRDPGGAAEIVEIEAAEMAADRAWLGMRTSDGVTELSLRPAEGLAEALLAEGLAEQRNGRLCPTLRGFLMADQIAGRIVQTWRDDLAGAL